MLQYLFAGLLTLTLVTNNTVAIQAGTPTTKTNQTIEVPRAVMVLPVDYFYFTWGEWGLPNDYLQEKLITDLTAAFSEKYRFYSEADMNEQAINPDLVVRMDFSNISIGQPKTINEDYGRGTSLKTISSPSMPPNSLYTSNTLGYNFATTTVESKAALNCIIYDWQDDDTALTQEFSGTHKWEGTAIEFRTRNEAIRKNSNEVTQNNIDKSIIQTPLKDEIAKKLMDICYKKAFKKIKAELELNNK